MTRYYSFQKELFQKSCQTYEISSRETIQSPIFTKLRKVDVSGLFEPIMKKVGVLCERSKDMNTRLRCSICGYFVCNRHLLKYVIRKDCNWKNRKTFFCLTDEFKYKFTTHLRNFYINLNLMKFFEKIALYI